VEITEFVVYEPGQHFEIAWSTAPAPRTLGLRTPNRRAAGRHPDPTLTSYRKRFEPLIIRATLIVFWRFHRCLKHALEAG
jgi:hypothetical protein